MISHRLLLGTGLLTIGLTGCGGFGGPHPTGTGPFDSHGNYVEAWADDPSKWNGRSVPTPESEPARETRIVQAPKPQATPAAVSKPVPAVVSRPTPPPRVQTVSNPAPKPRAAPKPKPKPQPKFASHQVRKGDTLYALAKKYGTSVGTIQKANGISGSVIRLGETLRIPL